MAMLNYQRVHPFCRRNDETWKKTEIPSSRQEMGHGFRSCMKLPEGSWFNPIQVIKTHLF